MSDASEPKRWPYLDRTFSYAEAVAYQERARRRIRRRRAARDPERVTGVDVGVRGRVARAAVVTLSFPRLDPLEWAVAERAADFPYIPGLLGFREVPVVLDALAALEGDPGTLFVDGHGEAHPRRFGVACHVGLEAGLPSIGIGKSLLVGTHREPARRRGSRCRLVHEGEAIGVALRTRDGVRPVFVSVGNLVELADAVRWVLRAAPRFRLPEPIRAADHLAGTGRVPSRPGGGADARPNAGTSE